MGQDGEAMDTEPIDDASEDTYKKVDPADDPLFENVRFAREELEDRKREQKDKAQEVKAAKPKIDLRELVKQDFKKIVSSIDYDDEEKYEGGKKISKRKASSTSAELSNDASTSASSPEEPSNDVSTSALSAEPSEEVEAEVKEGKSEQKDTRIVSVQKSGKRITTTNAKGQKKRVKTVAGTFNVSSN